MYRIYHGVNLIMSATDIQHATNIVNIMLNAGYSNVLICRHNVEVEGETTYNESKDYNKGGPIGTLTLNIPIYP